MRCPYGIITGSPEIGVAIGVGLSAISERIPEASGEPAWLPLKHHLFNTHIPKKIFKAIRVLVTTDKQDEFKLHIGDTFSRRDMIIFYRRGEKAEQTAVKVANSVLTNWVSFSERMVLFWPIENRDL